MTKTLLQNLGRLQAQPGFAKLWDRMLQVSECVLTPFRQCPRGLQLFSCNVASKTPLLFPWQLQPLAVGTCIHSHGPVLWVLGVREIQGSRAVGLVSWLNLLVLKT